MAGRYSLAGPLNILERTGGRPARAQPRPRLTPAREFCGSLAPEWGRAAGPNRKPPGR